MQFSSKSKSGPDRFVYIKLPWISKASMQLLEQIKRSVNCCFNLAKLHLILKSDVLFPSYQYDNFFKNFIIYKFSCKCDACYIGCTTQRLDIRMNQRTPFYIRTNTLNYSAVSRNQNPPSAIARHLLDNPASTAAYNPTMFSILESSSNEIHLSILKAFFISKYQPFQVGICKYRNNSIHWFFLTILLDHGSQYNCPRQFCWLTVIFFQISFPLHRFYRSQSKIWISYVQR